MHQMRTIGSLSHKRLPANAQVSKLEPMLMVSQIAPKPSRKEQKVLNTERKLINQKREFNLRIETVKAETISTKEKDWENGNY